MEVMTDRINPEKMRSATLSEGTKDHLVEKLNIRRGRAGGARRGDVGCVGHRKKPRGQKLKKIER